MTAVASSSSGTPSHDALIADLDDVVRRTSSLWSELDGQRLFVTGGTGFVGVWLLGSLVRACEVLGINAEAVVLTRRPERFRARVPWLAGNPRVKLLDGDLHSFQFPATASAYLIHAAAAVHGHADPQHELQALATSVDGTRHVLDYARSAGVRKVLLLSSGAVYGRQQSSVTHVSEDYPGAPQLHDSGAGYGEGKRAAELMCLLEGRRSGFETKIARCFTFVGPFLPLDSRFAAGNFIRDVLKGTPIRVTGDGTAIRSYLYAADLAVWLWTILFKGVAERPYNVGSDRAVSVADVAAIVSASVTPKADVIVEKHAVAAGIPERYVPDTKRARSELNLHSTIDLTEAIQRTIAWHRSA